MSVLLQNESGCFICSKTYFNQIYESYIDENSIKKNLKIRDVYFQIKTPYLMNSAAKQKSLYLHRKESLKAIKKSKGKKESSSFTEVDSIIKEVTNNLIESAHKLNFLDSSEVEASDWFENNSRAREASKEVPEINFQSDLFYHNSCSIPVVKVLQNNKYILPANSTFHLCNISNITSLKGTKYDLVVLDPPWENKSVKRKKGYSMLSCESLKDLNIGELLNPGCLIVVWVTNNKKQVNFVKSELFSEWNVITSTIWHWSKVTQKGHFIHPINSQHKKPYENILIGRVAFNERGSNAHSFPDLKSDKVILSVPSSIHSHKPPLTEVLKPYIPEHPKCLELFARYLLPGWTSVGNEVLKLQNMKLFEELG